MIDDSEFELQNPLVLAAIATVSLGASLIAFQNVGTTAAWAVGTPAAVAFARILVYAARGTAFVARVAYQDAVGASAPSDVEVER